MVPNNAIMSIDGSTSTTGVSIILKDNIALSYILEFVREKNNNETPVQFKVRMKREIEAILKRNRLINEVIYEEPFVGHITSVANLMMLRTFVEEIIVEQEPYYDYINHYEVNNQRWKKLFLDPEKVPSGTQNQEAIVKAKLLTYYPFMDKLSQDAIDATAMGVVAAMHSKSGLTDELMTKKKQRPFQYEMAFIGANEDEGMLNDFMEIYSGPSRILENGITLTEIKGKTNFDQHIYQNMGQDDKVLIVKFNSNHHGNIILQHRIGNLAATFEYIYAVIWRRNRK